jgi:hypothetical protein
MLPITWIIHLFDMIPSRVELRRRRMESERGEEGKLNNAAFVVFIGLVS